MEIKVKVFITFSGCKGCLNWSRRPTHTEWMCEKSSPQKISKQTFSFHQNIQLLTMPYWQIMFLVENKSLTKIQIQFKSYIHHFVKYPKTK